MIAFRFLSALIAASAAAFPIEVRTFFTTADGLPSNDVTALIISNGKLFAKTPAGVAELRLDNRSGQPRSFSIRRREDEPTVIREISDGSKPLEWNFANGYISFEVGLSAGESKVVQVRYHFLGRDGRDGDALGYKFRAMLRRYLCEIRDNYVTTAKLRVANRLGHRDQQSEALTR